MVRESDAFSSFSIDDIGAAPGRRYRAE